jgi:hypothetical protein
MQGVVHIITLKKFRTVTNAHLVVLGASLFSGKVAPRFNQGATQ